MAIGVTIPGLGHINDTTDATTFSSPDATTATASVLEVNVIQAVRASAEPATPTVTHSGVTATIIYSFFWTTTGGNQRKIWITGSSTGGAPTSTVTTVNFGGVTHTLCQLHKFEVTGSDVANGLAQTFVQGVNSTADAAGALSGSITLAAGSHSDNRPFAVWGHAANELTTLPRVNWTEIRESANATPNTAWQAQWRSDAFDTTSSASWDISSTFGGVAFEIKALAGGAAATVIDPMGMRGFFGG